MTSGEIAAAALAGKVVAHAGKELAEESKSIKKELLDQAKQTPQFAEGAKSYATRVALRQEILTRMFKPIAKMLGVANKYFEEDFEADMAKKLADVPEENIVAPKASLAAPAMQHLGYSLDEPSLKELYLNLLATASDGRQPNAAHPSFVEIIKQLSAPELPFLESLLKGPVASHPAIEIRLTTEGSIATRRILRHVVEITPATEEAMSNDMAATYIDNWCRLGLITADYETYLSDESEYAWADTHPWYLMAKEKLENETGETVKYEKGLLTVTSFGIAFARVVGIRENS